MIEIVQAPNTSESKGMKLFLAGGISNCPNWQNELTTKLINEPKFNYKNSGIKIIVFNPRCKNVPEENPQIIWEHDKLISSDIISFWFSAGSLNPITLFEYGSYFKSLNKTIIVGCDPDYIKRNNVIVQTKLERPDLTVFDNFNDFYNEIVKTLINKNRKKKWGIRLIKYIRDILRT